MSVARIASRYAKSLLQLAVEQNKLEPAMEDMQHIGRLLDIPDFHQLLKSPVVPVYKKTKIIKQLFTGKLDELTMQFFLLLLQKQREVYMPDIVREFIKQYKEVKNINTVKVTSAVPLTPATLENIRKKLLSTGLISGAVEFVEEVDPDLIGGLVLEFKDYIFDASVAQRLRGMQKAHFEENPFTSKFIAR